MKFYVFILHKFRLIFACSFLSFLPIPSRYGGHGDVSVDLRKIQFLFQSSYPTGSSPIFRYFIKPSYVSKVVTCSPDETSQYIP